MALPASGPISGSQIGAAVGASAPYSLRSMSSTASFSTPDAMSEFYGYSRTTVYFIVCEYIIASPSGYVYLSLTTTENVNTDVSFNWFWGGDFGSFLVGTATIPSGSNYVFSSVYGAAANEYNTYLFITDPSPSSYGTQVYSNSYSYCY